MSFRPPTNPPFPSPELDSEAGKGAVIDGLLILDHVRRWVRVPGRMGWVQFGRKTVPWRILLELCRARIDTPGRPIGSNQLIKLVWSGQSLLLSSAHNRLYVAMNTLRNCGLRDVILTHDDGYMVVPSVEVQWWADSRSA